MPRSDFTATHIEYPMPPFDLIPQNHIRPAAIQLLHHMAFPPVNAMSFSYNNSCSVAVGATRLHMGTKPAQSEVTPCARTTCAGSKEKVQNVEWSHTKDKVVNFRRLIGQSSHAIVKKGAGASKAPPLE